MHGFHGRLLHIDLTTGQSRWAEIAESRLRLFLGGIGLGASLIYDYAPAGVDPLAPANPLIFTSAPLVGTGLTTTAKYAVVTKSPLTGFIADSLSSSHFAIELKRVGIDALVITGKAAQWSYLLINNDQIEIRDADHLRGMSPANIELRLRTELKIASVRVAAIGKAGENLVRFATISNEGRHAGRGGVGAVMGAKHLKAIALCGNHSTTVADPSGVDAIAESLRQRSLSSITDKYREIGTVANLSVFNRLATLPTRNFQQAQFNQAEAVSGEALTATKFSRRHGCASCTIQCERLFKALNGEEQRLEYETLFALGPLCGIDDPDALLQAAQLCDEFGMDTISAGGTIAWAMECNEKGLLSGLDALRCGNAAGVLATLSKIAENTGLGALLAQGSRRAAEQIGGDSADWAMQVKGLELPGYDPRSLKTMALGLAVNPRGACHNRSGAYEADFSGAVNHLTADTVRAEVVARSEDFAAVLDSMIVCKFLRNCFDDFYGEAATLISRITGWNFSSAELQRVGERIHTMKKLFDIREGWQARDDWLPRRVFDEPVRSDASSIASLQADELRRMIACYYRTRGWDEHGGIPPAKLADLSLPPLAR